MKRLTLIGLLLLVTLLPLRAQRTSDSVRRGVYRVEGL